MSGATSPIAPAALQTLLDGNSIPSSTDRSHHALALQIQHNLQYQQRWTALTLHTHSSSTTDQSLPRPLISGLPPKRLYVHPDEQAEGIARELRERKQGNAAARWDPQPQREWVLPTHLRENWTLRSLAAVFDAIAAVPPEPDSMDGGKGRVLGKEEAGGEEMKWRMVKRVVLAVLQDDSTVVYYVVHDGIVKPRQN